MTIRKNLSKIVFTMILCSIILYADRDLALAKSSGTCRLYIDGTELSNDNVEAFKKDGIIYVPAVAVVYGMGDDYNYKGKKNILTITRSDGKTVVFDASLRVVTIDEKEYPLKTKLVNGKRVSENLTPILKNNVMYVPVASLKTYMKYKVTSETDGNLTSVYVGQVVAKTTPIPTPTAKDDIDFTKHATSNRKTNIDWVAENLGFYRNGDIVAYFNPANISVNGSLITVGYDDDYGTALFIENWGEYEWYTVSEDGTETYHSDNNTNKNVKSILRFYLPMSYEKLYTIIDNGNNGKGGREYLNKDISYDGMRVKLIYKPSQLMVFIGTNDLK